jgi:hypothetical protein
MTEKTFEGVLIPGEPGSLHCNFYPHHNIEHLFESWPRKEDGRPKPRRVRVTVLPDEGEA